MGPNRVLWFPDGQWCCDRDGPALHLVVFGVATWVFARLPLPGQLRSGECLVSGSVRMASGLSDVVQT